MARPKADRSARVCGLNRKQDPRSGREGSATKGFATRDPGIRIDAQNGKPTYSAHAVATDHAAAYDELAAQHLAAKTVNAALLPTSPRVASVDKDHDDTS